MKSLVRVALLVTAAATWGTSAHAANVDCLGCHAGGPAAKGAPVVDPVRLAGSAHAGLGCLECHPQAAANPHPRPLPPVACQSCHDRQGSALALSVHGLRRPEAPDGVNRAAAGCTDCHGTHGVRSTEAIQSGPGRTEVAAFCARCHERVAAVYRESVHGKAVASGIEDAPTCTNCHGEHVVAATSEPGSKVAARNIPRTCAACHDQEKVASRLGLPVRRLATYLDSYHGVVNQHGEAAVANCASCHGVHDIRPAADPQSSIHPDNLGRTCGTCHPGAQRGLAGARIHVEADPKSSLGMYVVRVFYTGLIGVLMVGFVAYMGIELYGTWRRRKP